jgi:cytochrome b subunit of formate dehydrogenase
MTTPEERNPAMHPIAEDRHYMRFSRLNRILHILMILSFISLALTGMSLKFSYTTWAAIMSRFFGGFESAGYIHRFAATVMIGVFIAHLVDLFRRKHREKTPLKDMIFGKNAMMFNRKDLDDLIASVKWFIGKGERPAYGRWTYWEKFDYFAVFWGMVVIGSTGLTLWFPELFTHVIPGYLINVATIVHSDEALLAVGFIFTVHFFNTHLRPEKFPMDTVIFTGRMPVEELAEDKPMEYQQLVESGELEKHLVEAYPPIVMRAIRFFGWTAVALGLGMVVLIVYAMVFAYQ